VWADRAGTTATAYRRLNLLAVDLRQVLGGLGQGDQLFVWAAPPFTPVRLFIGIAHGCQRIALFQ
jgi:hypothetical protein